MKSCHMFRCTVTTDGPVQGLKRPRETRETVRVTRLKSLAPSTNGKLAAWMEVTNIAWFLRTEVAWRSEDCSSISASVT